MERDRVRARPDVTELLRDVGPARGSQRCFRDDSLAVVPSMDDRDLIFNSSEMHLTLRFDRYSHQISSREVGYLSCLTAGCPNLPIASSYDENTV
jgi:hypothetical protein